MVRNHDLYSANEFTNRSLRAAPKTPIKAADLSCHRLSASQGDSPTTWRFMPGLTSRASPSSLMTTTLRSATQARNQTVPPDLDAQRQTRQRPGEKRSCMAQAVPDGGRRRFFRIARPCRGCRSRAESNAQIRPPAGPWDRETHRVPSNESPPPGTVMRTCGC